jgi:ribosomal protein S27E
VQAIEGSGGHLPQFVRQEFEEYLKCGLLEHGFLRVKCDGCRHEHLVAFSCKRRGFCPSCGARRMVESAAHLVDHVFPEQPVRQWVLTFPFPLRFLLAAEPRARPGHKPPTAKDCFWPTAAGRSIEIYTNPMAAY